jgi:DNA-binding CsgD family transcriptional regulator
MITNADLDTLTDYEILVLNYVLNHMKYKEIAYTLDLEYYVIAETVRDIYRKFRIYKHSNEYLREVWKRSVEYTQKELKKKRDLLLPIPLSEYLKKQMGLE